MTANQWIYLGVTTLIGLCLGIIGFFVRRTVKQVDDHETALGEIKENYVTKDELDDLQGSLRQNIKKLSDGIDVLRDNSIRKDDFVRAMSDMQRRQDRIFDVLLELKGGKPNG